VSALRVTLALLGKEVQQHAPALLGASVLCAVSMVVAWTMGLQEHWVTLLTAAHALCSYGLPMLVLFVAERLVVHDHQAGTHEFLAALPIAPSHRAFARWIIGFVLVIAAMLVVLLATAAVASRREGVPASFVAALAVQLGVYLYAWFGLAFGIAHLGRYRWLVWWLFFVSEPLAEALLQEPLRNVFWFGLVLDGADRSRLAPPWSAIPLALLWGTAGTALGFAVSMWRGGWLLERWFRPVTADERARLIGIGMAGMLATGVFEDQVPRTDPWETLPGVDARRATVRIAGSPGSPLWEVGVESAAALDALGEALGIERWPALVLVRARPELGVPAVSVVEGPQDALSRVLQVDLDADRAALVRGVVAQGLAHKLAGLQDWDPDAQWLVDGLAPWWLGADTERLQRQAALAAGKAERAAADWLLVRGELGPEQASAAAWASLVGLEQQRGREAVLALGRAVLAPRRGTSWPSGARLRFTTRGDWVGRTSGLARAELVSAWEGVLSRATEPAVLPPLPPLRIEVRGGEIVADWEGDLPPQTVLEWHSLDPLQSLPLPSDRTERLPPGGQLSELSLRVDLRLRAAARWVHEHPELGLVVSPWVVGP
jgi:hypothetical protein